MAKQLRLGFAMGGGVSLGTFSGAALTEAIKQYMVYGLDENYGRVNQGTEFRKNSTA